MLVNMQGKKKKKKKKKILQFKGKEAITLIFQFNVIFFLFKNKVLRFFLICYLKNQKNHKNIMNLKFFRG